MMMMTMMIKNKDQIAVSMNVAFFFLLFMS